QAATPDEAPPAAEAGSPVTESERDFFFDRALEAMANGDLALAARAFDTAAGLPGDPARRAVAASFADRVRRLEAQRARQPARRRSAPAADEAREGRVPFLTLTSALGVGLYGWTLPLALGIDAGNATRGFLGVYMLTAAASFFGPYFLT